MPRLLTGASLVLLAWSAVQVSLRAITQEGSGKMAAVQAQRDEQQGQSPIASLQRAVELSPREALYHSRLGLALESQGDLANAEKELLTGAGLSRKYEPHWDLLNFYFRRADWDRFWPAVADALPISWGDRSPLFELVSQVPDGQARLQQMLPTRRDVRFNYAVFLITKGDMPAAAPFLAELAGSATPEEKPTFLYWIDLMLQKRMVAEALQSWNALREPGDPFPWKPYTNPGVTTHYLEDNTWQIVLNGSQPEHCILLESVKPVTARAAYRLEAVLEEKLSPSGGLSWRIETLETTPHPLDQPFTVPAGLEAVKIRLEYQRPTGSVRAEGSVRVRSARLQKVP